MAEAEPRLVLASGSQSRRAMLQSAGVAFDVVPSSIDEAAVKREIEAGGAKFDSALGPCRAIARRLAREKAEQVSRERPGFNVIGADQTLALLEPSAAGERAVSFDKPASHDEARGQLVRMRGRTHVLCSAVAVAVDGKVVWDDVEEARLTMRGFSDTFLDDYLARAGDKVCTSVGAYQLEGLGIQLFERIEGDYFTILGMPLLPLLAELRRRGVIAS